jgi:hypothetical protein
MNTPRLATLVLLASALDAHPALHRHASGLPDRDLGGLEPGGGGVAVALYAVRMFAITGFYHRYFSHRSFKTSRAGQFASACSAPRRAARPGLVGRAPPPPPRHSDRARGPHSPLAHGFIRSHMGWFLTRKGFAPDLRRVRTCCSSRSCAGSTASTSWCRWLLALGMFGLGVLLENVAPQLGTDGLADAGVGLLHLDRGLLPRHLHDQLAVARVRQAALRDRRRQPQQLAGWR